MARKIPEDRFRQLIAVATEVFIAQGYRRTQMGDIANRLGVAKGTLYGYVEGKEALFDSALRYCDGLEALPQVSELPMPTPKLGATALYLTDRIARESKQLLLAKAVSDREASATLDFAQVCSDLYARIYRSRHSIKLIDRCALDHPELAKIWFGAGRWHQHALLVEYLEKETLAGRVRPLSDIPLSARLILETIVFWALHRHWDPSPQELDEGQVGSVVIDLLLHGVHTGGKS